MKRFRLFVFILAIISLMAIATTGCVGENLAPTATGLRLVKGPSGAMESVPQLVINIDEHGTPSAMGISPKAIEGALAQFGMTLGDVDSYRLPAQAMSAVENQNIEHAQLFIREMANGRFVYLHVNGEEMIRVNWAARNMIVETLKTTNAVPTALLNTITQGLDALEATGDVDADFGIVTHVHNVAIAAGTATPLVWPPTQAELDAEAAASAAATATAYPTATPTQTPLEVELVAAATPSAPKAPWDGVHLSGYFFSPLAYESGNQAARRLATQGFDRGCLEVFFAAVIEGDEADNGRWDWWKTSYDIPLPAVCLAN